MAMPEKFAAGFPWESNQDFLPSSDKRLKTTVNTLPFPSSLSTRTTAPWYLAACFTMLKPSPVPPFRFDRLLSTR